MTMFGNIFRKDNSDLKLHISLKDNISSLQTSPIFIIGCPRSGTTIIGNFFQNNSKALYFNEVNIWAKNDLIANQTLKLKLIIKIWKGIRKIIPATMFVRRTHWYTTQLLRSCKIMAQEKNHRLTESDLTQEMIDQVKYILERDLSPEKTLVTKSVKSSLCIPFLKKLFSNARFVHIIRDGRDVASSIARGSEGKTWIYPKPPGWKKIQKELTGPERGAWIWNTIIEIIKNDEKKNPSKDYYEIRYEEFVKNPEKTIRSLFFNLDLPFEKPQEELCKKVSNKNKKEFLTNSSSDDWATFDHSTRIGRYKENLTSEMIKKVETILGKTNTELGYT